MTSRPIHLAKGKIVTRIQAANLVLEATPSPELLKKLEADSPATDKLQLTVKERQELLLAALKKDSGLDRLKDWPPALAAKAIRLLLEFHYIFSLEPNEIGCTDATEHTIKLLNDEPFKERFRRIAPPPPSDGGGKEAHPGNAGWRSHSTFAVAMVQRRGAGQEEGRLPPLLY